MKKRVLFVGSFIEKAKDGSVGGQMYACKSLLNSSLSGEVDWILLDTTGESVPPPPVYIRMFYALWRVIKFIYLLIFRRPDCTLIFSANGPSIYEKGTMAFLSSLFSIKTIFAPRGGPLVNEVKKSKALKKFLIFSLTKSSYTICQGLFWKSFFQDMAFGQPANKFVVIPNWMDIDNYTFTSPQKKAHNVLIRKFTILFMGWIQEDKGVYDIFNAVSRFSFGNTKLKFVFLGDGPAKLDLKEKFHSQYPEYETLFPGWVHGDDKSRYLAEADIFILASYAEGMPNSLMEAMASGIACIASNVGAVPDLITNGETGIMVNVKDPDGINKAIQLLISDDVLRSKIVVNARHKIESNHSLESAVDKFKRLINN